MSCQVPSNPYNCAAAAGTKQYIKQYKQPIQIKTVRLEVYHVTLLT